MRKKCIKKSILFSIAFCFIIAGCGSGKVNYPSPPSVEPIKHEGKIAIGINNSTKKISKKSAMISTPDERLLSEIGGVGNIALVKELPGYTGLSYFEMTDSGGNTYFGVIGTSPTRIDFDKTIASYEGNTRLFMTKNEKNFLLQGAVTVTINYGNGIASMDVNGISVINSQSGENIDFGANILTINNIKLDGNILSGSQSLDLKSTLFDGQTDVSLSAGLFGNDLNVNIADEIGGVISLNSDATNAQGIFIAD